MAKKKAVEESSNDSPEVDVPNEAVDAREGELNEGAEESLNDSPEVHAADEAVRLAEAELKKAQQTYARIRQEATERLKGVREKTLGDLIDGLLAQVKKHPGPGVLIAMLAGLFLGRIFRR